MNRTPTNAPWGSFRRAPVRSTGARDFRAIIPPAGRQSFGAWQPARPTATAGATLAGSTSNRDASDTTADLSASAA
jgi:hypothetical protein